MREGLKLMTSDSITLPIRRRRFDNIRCIGMMLTLMLVLGSMNACSVKEELSEAPVTSDQSVDDKLSDTALELKTLEARERFDADIERLAIEVLENSPLHASFVLGDLKRHGLMHLAAELDHVGAKQSEKDLRMAEKQLTRLHETDYMLLDEMQKDIYRMAEFNLRYSIALNSHPYAFNLISPSSGIQISIPLTLMQIEFESVEEIDAFVARVKELPRLLDEVIAYEQERFALGYGMPGRMYEEAAVQIDAMLGPVDEFMMYRSFSDKVDAYEGLENAIKEEYKENYYSIVENDLYPAFERVKDQAVAMQESELSGSVSEWPNGKEYYETLIGYKTSEELMEIDELRAWSDESRKKYDGLFWEIFEENPDLFDLDFETLFDEYDTIEEVYETVDKAYESQFKDYGVDLASENIIPDYLEDYLALGFYFPVTVDGEDYGNMFLQKDEYESITLDTLLLYFHENIPGHHLYFSYIASSDDPLLRKMNEYRSFEEGWATYVQDMVYSYLELPDGVDEYYNAVEGYYDVLFVMWDMSLHIDGKPMDELIETLEVHGYSTETAEKIVYRIISDPGETIHYKYGNYKMRQMKERYMEIMGEDFDPKEFHDLILRNYGLPFYIVDEKIEALK